MHRWIATGGLGLLAATATSQSTAVSPADRAGLEGSTSTSYPLGRHDCRFQQLFGDLDSPRTLRGHAYRRDGLGSRRAIPAFKTQLEVRLATAGRAPLQISRDFAVNLGTPVTVLPKTWISFPKTDRPGTPPGPFDLRVPYKTPYAWSGQGDLCVDTIVWGNDLATGRNKTFTASLDAHQLYNSGRNLQPGYRFGTGCAAGGKGTPSTATFEIRHVGKRIDLNVVARRGVPHSAATPAQSVLLLSPRRREFPWPPGSGCTVYGTPTALLFLPGPNSAAGDWTGTVDVGPPPPAMFEMIGQILSVAPRTGQAVLSDASRLIAPPPGKGLVSARLVSASDRTASSGTISFSVPVTQFF